MVLYDDRNFRVRDILVGLDDVSRNWENGARLFEINRLSVQSPALPLGIGNTPSVASGTIISSDASVSGNVGTGRESSGVLLVDVSTVSGSLLSGRDISANIISDVSIFVGDGIKGVSADAVLLSGSAFVAGDGNIGRIVGGSIISTDSAVVCTGLSGRNVTGSLVSGSSVVVGYMDKASESAGMIESEDASVNSSILVGRVVNAAIISNVSTVSGDGSAGGFSLGGEIISKSCKTVGLIRKGFVGSGIILSGPAIIESVTVDGRDIAGNCVSASATVMIRAAKHTGFYQRYRMPYRIQKRFVETAVIIRDVRISKSAIVNSGTFEDVIIEN